MKPRVAFSGSRTWSRPPVVKAILLATKATLGDFVAVHGAHHEGADRDVRTLCRALGIEDEPHPAEWERYNVSGRKNPAGQIRNREMARSEPVVCVIFRAPGKSNGTDGMTLECLSAGVPVITVPENIRIATVEALVCRLTKSLADE